MEPASNCITMAKQHTDNEMANGRGAATSPPPGNQSLMYSFLILDPKRAAPGCPWAVPGSLLHS